MTSKAVAVVLARMTSNRLPGKVLRPLCGKPVLEYLLERLEVADCVDRFVVATSATAADDNIAEYCATREVPCFRGSLDDVAGRTLGAANSLGAEFFFRANADSPLLAIDLFEDALAQLDRDPADLVTNVNPRTHPPGASVELIRTAALERACQRMSHEEREHVTLHFYRNSAHFQLAPLETSRMPHTDPNVRLVVDDATDFQRMTTLIEMMDRPHWEYDTEEVIALAREALA